LVIKARLALAASRALFFSHAQRLGSIALGFKMAATAEW
jgi:hypothetical protein